jgi:hypothetical protein
MRRLTTRHAASAHRSDGAGQGADEHRSERTLTSVSEGAQEATPACAG